MNIYAYNMQNLWVAYGLAIFATLVTNILAIFAYRSNRVAHGRSFSDILSFATDPSIRDLFSLYRHGVLPMPRIVRDAQLKVRFTNRGGSVVATSSSHRIGGGDDDADDDSDPR
jgi:hypothetical protein